MFSTRSNQMKSFVISPHDSNFNPATVPESLCVGDCCRSGSSVSQEPLGFAVHAACELGGSQRAGRRMPDA